MSTTRDTPHPSENERPPDDPSRNECPSLCDGCKFAFRQTVRIVDDYNAYEDIRRYLCHNPGVNGGGGQPTVVSGYIVECEGFDPAVRIVGEAPYPAPKKS